MTHSDIHLLVLTEDQCALLVKALGHYADEYALIVEADLIEQTHERLAKHLPALTEPPC